MQCCSDGFVRSWTSITRRITSCRRATRVSSCWRCLATRAVRCSNRSSSTRSTSASQSTPTTTHASRWLASVMTVTWLRRWSLTSQIPVTTCPTRTVKSSRPTTDRCQLVVNIDSFYLVDCSSCLSTGKFRKYLGVAGIVVFRTQRPTASDLRACKRLFVTL